MSDKEVSLRDQVEAAYESIEETNNETSDVVDTRHDDSSDKIESKNDRSDDIQKEDHQEDKNSEVPDDGSSLSEAPTHWAPEDREAFNELDEKGRKLYLKRYKQQEAGFTKKSQGLAEERRIAENFKKVMATHEEHLKNIGVDPFMAVDKLLATEKLFRTGTPSQKADAFQKLARDYGINLNLPQQQYVAEQTFDPQTLALYQKVHTLEQHQQFLEQERVKRETHSLTSQIDSFQKAVDDKGEPKYPHFETLRMDMSEILQKGMASGLEDAYNKAVRLNDDLHQEYINRQYNIRMKEAETVKKTVASKKAGFNMKGSGGSALAEPSQTLSTRQVIEQAYDRQQKRQRI